MELVSLFCFGAEDGEGVMDPELFNMFMSYVIEAASSKTKDFSPFPEHGIDATPVVRSFLLQQLLRTRWVMKESVVLLIRGCLRYVFTCQVALRGHCFISGLDCVSFSHDPILGRSLHVTAEIRQLLRSLTDYLSFRINITLIPSFF